MMGQQRISDILFVMIVYVGYLYYNHDTMSNNAYVLYVLRNIDNDPEGIT